MGSTCLRAWLIHSSGDKRSCNHPDVLSTRIENRSLWWLLSCQRLRGKISKRTLHGEISSGSPLIPHLPDRWGFCFLWRENSWVRGINKQAWEPGLFWTLLRKGLLPGPHPGGRWWGGVLFPTFRHFHTLPHPTVCHSLPFLLMVGRGPASLQEHEILSHKKEHTTITTKKNQPRPMLNNSRKRPNKKLTWVTQQELSGNLVYLQRGVRIEGCISIAKHPRNQVLVLVKSLPFAKTILGLASCWPWPLYGCISCKIPRSWCFQDVCSTELNAEKDPLQNQCCTVDAKGGPDVALKYSTGPGLDPPHTMPAELRMGVKKHCL